VLALLEIAERELPVLLRAREPLQEALPLLLLDTLRKNCSTSVPVRVRCRSKALIAS
jgi:hypothetical protein